MTSNAKICNNCGYRSINLQDKFCTSCGADFTTVKQVRFDEVLSNNASALGAEYGRTPNAPKSQLAIAFRRFLPGRQTISEEERNATFKYLNDHSAVIVLQTREADRYNSTHSVHSNHLNQTESIHELLEASNRLLICADECVLQHRNLLPVPDRALRSYNAWEDTFDVYRQWVRATYEAFLALSEARTPDSRKVQTLYSEQQKFRILADREDLRLGRAYGLDASNLRRIVNQTDESNEEVRWEPDTQLEDIGSQVIDKDVG